MARESKQVQPESEEQVFEHVENTEDQGDQGKPNAEIEKMKSELAGLDRRNSALEKQIKKRDAEITELRKAQMDADERFKFELDDRERKLAERERELRVRENKEKAAAFLNENALPTAIADILPLDDWDNTAAKLTTLKSVVETDRASVLEAYKTKGGARPSPGGVPVSPNVKKSEMTVEQANEYARQHGVDAFMALPD